MEELIQQQPSSGRIHSTDTMNCPIQGMESIVATVSGYHGSERCKLIKLISQTGASYVGTMKRSTTHLVCWKFKGPKYDLAKQFKALIVNHRWVEDCIKQGRRVPEHPYILRSGREMGPLLLEVPPVTGKRSLLLSEQPNKQKRSKAVANDMECEGTNDLFWPDSRSLDKLLFPEVGTSNNRPPKLKNKTVEKSSRQRGLNGSRDCLKEPQQSSVVRIEEQHQGCESSSSRMRMVRQESSSDPSSQPSHKGRRLVKRSTGRENLDVICLDTDHEIYPFPTSLKHNEITAPSKRRNGNILRNLGNSDGESSDRVNKKEGSGHVLGYKDTCIQMEGASSSLEQTPEDHPQDANDKLSDSQNISKLPKSTELSCVICWTDFSSTRGVLPCGHRFCFSCIQNWADHMIAMRKTSTCPLCKASFVCITKVDDVVSSDQKIYSQTIPFDPSTTDIIILQEGQIPAFGAQHSVDSPCCECCCREPEDLLIRCHICKFRRIHSYCLDPPLFPWTCIHCKDLQRLYNHLS